jgi:hypothetical protein
MSVMQRLRFPTLALLLGALPGCAVEDVDDQGDSDSIPFEWATVATADGEREIAFQRLGDGTVLLEGDMLLDEDAVEAARVDGDHEGARAAVRTVASARWANGIVPFVIDPALPDPDRVTQAIAHWEANTPFRFVARTNQADFVRFVPSTVCNSLIGRNGGQQNINLAPDCGTGQAIHEIGHAIGFWHEQSRQNRDDFVTIHWECIRPNGVPNFNKYPDGEDTGPYDYRSIMHYGRRFFTNGCDTITPTFPDQAIGQRDALSPGDILGAFRIFTGTRPGVTFLAADYDGDGRADLSAKDDTGTWRIDYASDGFGTWAVTVGGYGAGDAVPLPRDYDGDGRADLSVKNSGGWWHIDYAADGFGAWNVVLGGYGGSWATALPADYDGDGKADLSVKDTGGYWHIDYASDGFGAWNQILGGYGGTWATAVPADYDGDGKADLSVKDTSGTWHIDYASDGFGAWNQILGGYGGWWATPVPADYDGDGKADLSVKDTGGYWHIDLAADGFGGWNQIVGGYGGSTATPLPADYDDDQRADLSVRDAAGIWYIDHAADSFAGWNVQVPLGL